MARRVNTIETRKPKTVVVGAGITEYWYLKHLKRKKGYDYVLKPSLFGNESMFTIQSRITENLAAGSSVVCIFDEDVRRWDQKENQRMDEIHRKYDEHDKVIIASSMPSIEYWLLLHFENTNRFFGTSSSVIEILRRHIVGFDKKEQYLKQDKWIENLLDDNIIKTAIERAKRFGHSGESYSDMWKAFDKFQKSDK